jgi:hypothetical protein
VSDKTAETIARAFHDEYEAFAEAHGWETQKSSRVAFDDLPEENRATMVSTVQALLDRRIIAASNQPPSPQADEVDEESGTCACCRDSGTEGPFNGYYLCVHCEAYLREPEDASPQAEVQDCERDEIEWNLPDRLRTEDQGADLEDELRTAATHACEEGKDERAGMLLEAAEVVEWAGDQLAARELSNGTGKQSPAEPDCDDLCTCGHERFHHDDGREMGVETNCKTTRDGKPCTCEQFEMVDDEEVVEQSLAEPQEDAVEVLAKEIHRIAAGVPWDDLSEASRDRKLARARDTVAAITPLLPGPALDRQRLEKIKRALKWKREPATKQIDEALDRTEDALAALDDPLLPGSSYVRERLEKLERFDPELDDDRAGVSMLAWPEGDWLWRSEVLAALDTPVPSEKKPKCRQCENELGEEHSGFCPIATGPVLESDTNAPVPSEPEEGK